MPYPGGVQRHTRPPGDDLPGYRPGRCERRRTRHALRYHVQHAHWAGQDRGVQGAGRHVPQLPRPAGKARFQTELRLIIVTEQGESSWLRSLSGAW
jgi:hypothetical protein